MSSRSLALSTYSFISVPGEKKQTQYRSDPELLYPINKATFDVFKMYRSKTQRAKRAKLTPSTPLLQSRKTVFLFIIFIAKSSFLNYPHCTRSPLASTAHDTHTSELADPMPALMAYI